MKNATGDLGFRPNSATNCLGHLGEVVTSYALHSSCVWKWVAGKKSGGGLK